MPASPGIALENCTGRDRPEPDLPNGPFVEHGPERFSRFRSNPLSPDIDMLSEGITTQAGK